MSGKKYMVRQDRLPVLQTKLERINRKAEKLGLPPVTMTASAPREVREDTSRGTFTYLVQDVVIDGQTPRIAGWDFLASLNHFVDEEDKPVTILRALPGVDLPERFRTIGPVCEHCHQNRRRAKTYVLQAEVSGEYKVVGSTCLSDFTGIGFEPERLADLCDDILDLCSDAEEAGEWGGPHQESWISLDSFLAVAAAYIRLDGFTSRAKSREAFPPVTATADDVADYFFAQRENLTSDQKAFLEAHQPTDTDHQTAQATREWLRTLGADTTKTLSDYEYNLRAVEQVGRVNARLFGIATSAITAYQRWLGKETARKLAAETSQHFGEVGSRGVYTVTVVSIFTRDGNYGTTYICKFIDAQGNQAVWFASKNPNLEIGKTYALKATIKGHSEYRGVKETSLTRCAVVAAAA